MFLIRSIKVSLSNSSILELEGHSSKSDKSARHVEKIKKVLKKSFHVVTREFSNDKLNPPKTTTVYFMYMFDFTFLSDIFCSDAFTKFLYPTKEKEMKESKATILL